MFLLFGYNGVMGSEAWRPSNKHPCHSFVACKSAKASIAYKKVYFLLQFQVQTGHWSQHNQFWVDSLREIKQYCWHVSIIRLERLHKILFKVTEAVYFKKNENYWRLLKNYRYLDINGTLFFLLSFIMKMTAPIFPLGGVQNRDNCLIIICNLSTFKSYELLFVKRQTHKWWIHNMQRNVSCLEVFLCTFLVEEFKVSGPLQSDVEGSAKKVSFGCKDQPYAIRKCT